MRNTPWIIPVLLLSAAIGAPSARADSITYTVTFTCTAPCGSSPTAPDVTIPPTFSPPIITWHGTSLVPNTGFQHGEIPQDSWTWIAGENLFGGSNSLGLQLTDVTRSPSIGYIFIGSYTGPSVPGDRGTMSFAPVVTPEPSSLALLLAGVVGVLLITRKRAGLQQDS